MSNFYTGDSSGYGMLNGWETSLAETIAVDSGTKKLNDAKIQLLNKRYEEGIGYKLSGNALYEYIAKNSGTSIMFNQDKVSVPVAKIFVQNIESAQKAEAKRIQDKLNEKNRQKWPWYKYAILGGGIVAFVALSPSINTIAKTLVRPKNP